MSHLHRRLVKVLDSYISYIDTRVGEFTVVLLHGNIASKYIWHDVIPHIHGFGRCLAPDLLGMGNSGMNPSNEYGYDAQFQYLQAWINLVLQDKQKVVMIGYEWGAALAMRWAYINPSRAQGLILIEGIFSPIRVPEDINSKLVQNIHMIVQKHLSLQHYNRKSAQRDDVMIEEYRNAIGALVATWGPDDGVTSPRCLHAIIDLFRDLPIVCQAPYNVITQIREINRVIGQSDVRKLMIEAEQGVYSAIGAEAAKQWKNTETASVGFRAVPTHMQPQTIGRLVVKFLKSLRQN